MRILCIHGYYQRAGGEDAVFEAECRLLEDHGHQVLRYTRHNDELAGMSPLRLCAVTLWNRATYRDVRDLIRRERPDAVHCHNLFPLVSPAAVWAAGAERVPVVMTLHNYRMACPAAVFFRDGRLCEDCLGRRIPWPAVRHACYRGSRGASAAVVLYLVCHRLLGTWRRRVTRFVALTDFARRKLMQAGLPGDRIDVKPPHVPEPAARRTADGRYVLFVGRLSPEKGVERLVDAWAQLPDVPLKIAGAGPLEDHVRQAAHSLPAVELLGWQTGSQVAALLADARALVLPSQWYEGLPLVLLEAYAAGVPVAASRMGAMPEIVEDGGTGVLFNPGDPADLRRAVRRLWDNPEAGRRMGAGARAAYAREYTPEASYLRLMDIYARALRRTTTP